LIKKSFFLLNIFFVYLFSTSVSLADLQKNLINKITATKTLSFNFKLNIAEKVEFGNCYIKYPLLMKCEYPKKKKSIIANGKKFVIVKKRYKKIYHYPLKKTPLFYLLKKENILNLVQNYEPITIDSNILEYELIENNSNKLKVFFDKNSLELLGWEMIDAYSNEVSFFLKNTETNILIKNEIFKIPREEDL